MQKPVVKNPHGRQAQKSAATRQAVVDATLSCIRKSGYGAVTMEDIAREAGVSRGAMMHHFPAKADVIATAVRMLHERRLATLRREIAAIALEKDLIDHALRAYWRITNTQDFWTFHQLFVAARTDRDLAATLNPLARRFDKEWEDAAYELFEPIYGAQTDLAIDLCQSLVEGMVLGGHLRGKGAKARIERLLGVLSARLHQIVHDAQ